MIVPAPLAPSRRFTVAVTPPASAVVTTRLTMIAVQTCRTPATALSDAVACDPAAGWLAFDQLNGGVATVSCCGVLGSLMKTAGELGI
jgi:hypothetical protein